MSYLKNVNFDAGPILTMNVLCLMAYMFCGVTTELIYFYSS